MTFRFPGWGIGWFTPLLALFAPVVAYGSFVDGSSAFGVFWLSVGLFAALTWFQQRWAAIPLVIYFLLALTGIAMSFTATGFSVSLLGKLLFSCSGIYELVVWYRSPRDKLFGDLVSEDLP